MSFYSSKLIWDCQKSCLSRLLASSTTCLHIVQATKPSRSSSQMCSQFIVLVYQTLAVKSSLYIIHNIIKNLFNHSVNLIGVLRLQLTYPTITHYRSMLTQNHSRSRFMEQRSKLNPIPKRLKEPPQWTQVFFILISLYICLVYSFLC